MEIGFILRNISKFLGSTPIQLVLKPGDVSKRETTLDLQSFPLSELETTYCMKGIEATPSHLAL